MREWLADSPFTLALSSGYFGFFAHFGVLAALDEAKLYPAEVCGSSAGALAAAFWASGCSINQSQKLLFNLSKKDIWDPGLGPGLLRGQLFRDIIQKHCPVSNIENCPIPLKISVFDLIGRKTHILEQGNISNAVYASCCVPLLFHPIRIRGTLYIDGGIKDIHGLAASQNGKRTFHHALLSQWPFTSEQTNGIPKIPTQSNRITLVIRNLPSPGINKLKLGQKAFDQALQSTRSALDQRSDNRIIVL